ncbi:hypothetical protein [Maritimibacter sp. HL-12]|uniref:hypothetical protein n=1 Tax=Maritimibacter sp. HL-12 TaxID=1162418 RepID=UPI000A0F0BCE|nr:hypothetical protein [Maritimibacter sp. HL-12]SMH40623.1 hypothetical protein SAMN05661107_1118 [Maritimibacter sp. HL-12]
MTREILTLGLGLGAILLATQALRAQETSCGERAMIVERLARDYGESRQSLGVVGGRQVLELFASDETGSWTILLTAPDGIACLVAAGARFRRFDPVAPGEPA